MTYKLEQIIEIAKTYFDKGNSSHDWDHTQRVLVMAERLALSEGADLDIVRYAAVLHDICRHAEDNSQGERFHEEEGAKEAEKILKQLEINDIIIQKVKHCIQSHRFRRGAKPQSLEAKVLFDADKLDGIGAIGIGRAFVFAGENGARVHDPFVDPENTESYSIEDTAYREYLVKLSKVKNRIYTESAKQIAEQRHAFMQEFFDRISKECLGEL